MAETDNDIDIKVGVDGVTQTVAELEKVNTAVSKSAKSTEQMAVAQKKVQEATTKSNVSIGPQRCILPRIHARRYSSHQAARFGGVPRR